MPVLYVLIGPSGSGKSYTAHEMFGMDPKTVYVSTDKIRGRMFGDEGCQDNPKAVFAFAYDVMRRSLQAGKNVVFDATSTTAQSRQKIIEQACDIACGKVAIVMTARPKVAKAQNAKRVRRVPDAVINAQYERYYRDAHTIPDQFDAIIVV